MESRKHKVAVVLAKYFLRTNRGRCLTSRFTDILRDTLDGTVYLFAIKGFFGIIINPKYLIGIVVLKTVLEYFLGWADQRWGFCKVENEITSNELNPFNQEMMMRIKRIEEMISKQSHETSG